MRDDNKNTTSLSSKCNYPHRPGQLQAFWVALMLGTGRGWQAISFQSTVTSCAHHHNTTKKGRNNLQHEVQKDNIWKLFLVSLAGAKKLNVVVTVVVCVGRGAEGGGTVNVTFLEADFKSWLCFSQWGSRRC